MHFHNNYETAQQIVLGLEGDGLNREISACQAA